MIIILVLVLMTVMRIIMQIFQYMIYILNFSFNKNSEARFQTSGVQWTSSQYVCVMKVQRRILIQRNVIMFIYSRKIWVISVKGAPLPLFLLFLCTITMVKMFNHGFVNSEVFVIQLFLLCMFDVIQILKFDCVCVITLCFKTDARQVLCVDYIIYIFSLLHYFCHGKYV